MHDPLHAFCTHVSVHLQGTPGGPLAGLTFAAKDNFDVAGYPTGAGSPDWLRTHGPAERTAPAVQALLDAGATLVGKAQMDEMAFSLAGQNAHYGTPVNPRAPDRIPGGSSSGSAAATAGGLVDFALGTDTAGSVRVPANNCGVFGFRPTHGRIPLDGVVPFSPSFDTVGFFAREAALLRRVGRVLLPPAPTSQRLSRLLVADDAFALADEKVREALGPLVGPLVEVLATAEHVRACPSGPEGLVEAFSVLRGAEVRATLGEWIECARPRFGPGIRERFDQARGLTEEAVAAARAAREEIRRGLDELLGAGGVLCLPTAPLLAPLRDSAEAEMARYRSQTLKLTLLASIGGLPQVSLPLAKVGSCPVGMSLVAGRGQDERLLDLAVEVEGRLAGR